MKKSLIILSVLLLFIANMYATTTARHQYEGYEAFIRNYAICEFEEEIRKETEESVYRNFIGSKIPAKFVTPFYEFTKDNKNLGLEVLGIAKHESNWKWFVGKRNANGSIDLGPLMLNSFNIENESFMKSFARNCEEYKNDTDIYFMLICINYYKSLREDFGPFSALQIYNGGWRTVRKNCPSKLKETVVLYANTVYKYINQYTDDYKVYVSENLESENEKHILKYMYIARYDLNRNSEIIKRYISSDCDDVYPRKSNQEIFISWLCMSIIYDEKFYQTYVLMDWPILYRAVQLNFKLRINDIDDDEENFIIA